MLHLSYPARVWILVGASLFVFGCTGRAIGFLDDTGNQPIGFFGDGPLVLPDGGYTDTGVPRVCQTPSSGWNRYDDPQQNFSLVLPKSCVATPIASAGASSADSLAVIDRDGVYAFVATRAAAAADPSTELSLIQRALFGRLTGATAGNASIRASGSSGLSAEGFVDVKEATFDVRADVPIELSLVRRLTMAAVLLREPSAISGEPDRGSETSTELLVRLTATMRPGQLAVTGAVVRREDYDAADRIRQAISLAVDDLSNGTGMALYGKSVALECDVGAVNSQPMADIIWVVDESGSMNDNRQDIVNNAKAFFEKALAAGLDFRMAVTGMKRPEPEVIMGKFCSEATDPIQPSHDGGQDRFLLPSERDLFTACMTNPPYYEGGAEHGLTNAYWAVRHHLPRANGEPDKIRRGAQLTIIFATDETAQELKQKGDFLGNTGFMTYTDYRKDNCSLSKDSQTQLSTFLTPMSDLVAGVSDPEGKATVHVIGGTCQNSCNAEVAWGYKELAERSGGQLGDVCQADLGATLKMIIDSVSASASPRKLQYTPISSTLSVEANNLELARSKTKGFMYNVVNNSLTFMNVKVSKGNVVVASYARFK